MEMVSKPCHNSLLHPILVHSIIKKEENIGSQMGHTFFKKSHNIHFIVLTPVKARGEEKSKTNT